MQDGGLGTSPKPVRSEVKAHPSTLQSRTQWPCNSQRRLARNERTPTRYRAGFLWLPQRPQARGSDTQPRNARVTPSSPGTAANEGRLTTYGRPFPRTTATHREAVRNTEPGRPVPKGAMLIPPAFHFQTGRWGQRYFATPQRLTRVGRTKTTIILVKFRNVSSTKSSGNWEK